MANILALDIGEKRIGAAIADSSAPFPAPLTTLEASAQLAAEFADILKKNHVKAVVIGLPRNQAGERTKQTERVERIAELLNIPKNIPIYWQDESLTSVKAEKELEARKKPYAKKDVDALAATYILDDFIREHPKLQLHNNKVSHPDATNTPEKEPTNKKWWSKKRVLTVTITGVAALLIFGAVVSSWWYKSSLQPRTKEDVYTVVTVQQGMGSKAIAAELESKDVIKSATAFSLYVRLHNVKTLQAGAYRLSSKQSVSEIVDTLSNGKVTTVNILIAPGQTLAQITKTLENDGFKAKDIEAALVAVRDHPLLAGEAANTKLEGYLFPDTYQIGPSTTAEEMIRLMLDTFQKKITPEVKSGIAAQGLTLHQAITLASIVQQEVSDPEVQPTVAQVFIKRYQIGMMLGSDVTSLYGAVLDGVDLPENSAARAAKAIAHDSPYNTRKVVGLPPTAISNFNFSALEAVAKPSATDYLFFVAGDDAVTHFSRTFEEHEALIKRYCIQHCG